MNRETVKGVIDLMLQQEPSSDFAVATRKIGIDTMIDLAIKAPGIHIYVPAKKTFNHWLAVMVIRDVFKKLDIASQEGKQRVKEIAELFKIKPYQIKKILAKGKFTR
jgi:hypothetical protein